MAERKKIQKMRSKSAPKYKPKNKSVKRNFKSENITESIKMFSSKEKQPTKKVSLAPQKTHTYKKDTKITSAPPKKTSTTKLKHKNSFGFSVIKGRKNILDKKRITTTVVSFIVIMSIIVFSLTSPTGPIEQITNAFSLIGGGKFPATLSGTKVLSFESVKNKVFALTNSHLCGYTTSGKNFLQLQHNFSNPVLDLSESRALIYNRESNKFIISDNNAPIFEESLKSPIFCADISRNGSVAFVLESKSYAAEIIVFNKNMKQYYSWYLADGLVSDIALSNNGRYVALSVLKVINGVFTSEIYCLDTKKQEPIFTTKVNDESVVKIESVSNSKFVYCSNKKLYFASWKTGEIANNNTSLSSPTYFNKEDDVILATYAQGNHYDIVFYNSSGKITGQYDFNGLIDDISVFNNIIYILSSNQLHLINITNTDNKIFNLDNKPDYILGLNNSFLSVNNVSLVLTSLKEN